MNEIRAFIGHSFAPDDADVVGVFLRYFAQVQDVLPTFKWTHARAAEPKELAAKVMSLVEDRNVFIGICTKKERVIADEKLQPSLLSQSTLKGHANDFDWKTSDWVIQEIGLAVGRGMAIVLLLENGCRKPGGIQGDVEFIPFDRATPERAFGQLLEMIRALVPPQAQAEAGSGEGADAGESAAAPEENSDHTPDETWDRTRYEMHFAWKLFSGKKDEAEQIESTYLKTPDAADPERKAEWQSLTEIWRIRAGEEGTLKRIEELKQSFPENVTVIANLAAAFAHFDHHGDAAEQYLEAAKLSESDPSQSCSFRASAAVELHKDGQRVASSECLSKLREIIEGHSDAEARLLYALKEIAEADKDDILVTQILERMVDTRPDDVDLRFELAYKYSQLKYADLSLYHYLQIPAGKRNPVTWNNIGVAFQNASLPGKSIEAYRTAAAEGETLAMSNIAYKLMNAGFFEDADAELQKALKLENYHRNVPDALAQLRDLPEKESSSLDDSQAKVRPKVEFVRRVGRALAQLPPSQLAKIWDGPLCKLGVSLKDGVFLGVGTYERNSSGLGSAFGSSKASTVTITYEGSLVGRRVVGKVTRKSDGSTSANTLLGFGIDDAGTDFVLIIEEGDTKLSVMESPTSSAPTFYEINRAGDQPKVETESD
jgi:tetratricopeptide (TPR) repeat protein